MWKAQVFTLYPEVFPGPLSNGLYGKALLNKIRDLEIVNIRESGFPDVLDYDGDGAVVISWADFTFKNKKSGNIKTISQHIQHWFNEEGEIVREDYYFNPAQLPQ